MADWARKASDPCSSDAVGKWEATGSGRSIGGSESKPNASAPARVCCSPRCSTAMRANDELQDSARISKSGPPQVWELAIGWPSGGVYEDSTGKLGSSWLITPNFRP